MVLRDDKFHHSWYVFWTLLGVLEKAGANHTFWHTKFQPTRAFNIFTAFHVNRSCSLTPRNIALGKLCKLTQDLLLKRLCWRKRRVALSRWSPMCWKRSLLNSMPERWKRLGQVGDAVIFSVSSWQIKPIVVEMSNALAMPGPGTMWSWNGAPWQARS